jgi:transposase
MGKLDGIPADRLRTALSEAEDAKAAKRLVVALAYKDDVHVDTIAARYGIPQSTIYYWLDRFATQPLADALEDESRPGRPPKLAAEQRETVESWLEEAPETFGYDAETWRAEDLRDHIREVFGVDYSVAHVGRTFLD